MMKTDQNKEAALSSTPDDNDVINSPLSTWQLENLNLIKGAKELKDGSKPNESYRSFDELWRDAVKYETSYRRGSSQGMNHKSEFELLWSFFLDEKYNTQLTHENPSTLLTRNKFIEFLQWCEKQNDLFIIASIKKGTKKQQQIIDSNLSLASAIKPFSLYRYVQNKLVDHGFFASVTFLWTYKERGKKKRARGLLRCLSDQGYFPDFYNDEQLAKIAKASFGFTITSRYISETTSDDVEFFKRFIKPATTVG